MRPKYLEILDAKDIINKSASPLLHHAGVYAWFRKLSLEASTAASFLSSVRNILAGETWPETLKIKREGKTGPYRTLLDLHPYPRELTTSKEIIARRVATNQQDLTLLLELVLEASILQPPLYVGKTNDLNERIRKHLQGESDFGKMIIQSPVIDFSQMIVAYIDLERFPARANELVEYIIGTATLPRYAKRTG